MEMKNYVAPAVELVEVAVEAGFAATGSNPTFPDPDMGGGME